MARRPWGSICASLALLGLTCGTPAHAAFSLESPQAVFTWEPASGPVEGYFVYVTLNGAPEQLDHATPTNQSLPIPGVPGDRLSVRVAAFDADANVGPVSVASETLTFVESPPNDDSPPADHSPPDDEPPPPDDEPPPPDDEPQSPGDGRQSDGTPTTEQLQRTLDDDGGSGEQQSKIKVELESQAAANGAKGSALFKLTGKGAVLSLRAKGLEPLADYELQADGATQALVTADKKGKLKLQLDARGGKDGQLWFDPRGRRVSLSDGLQDVLAAVVSGPSEPRKSKVKEKTPLEATDLAGRGSVQSHFQVSSGGDKRFTLKAKDVPPGSYRILLDGIEVGSLEANQKGKAKADFGGKAARLDFDPRGAALELEKDGAIYFSGEVQAQLPGFSICSEDTVAFDLRSTKRVAGSARADLEVDTDCNVRLRIELTNVPGDDYGLVVAGQPLAAIGAGNGHGMVELESAPTGSDLLLPFDPRGEPIEVERDGVVLFVD